MAYNAGEIPKAADLGHPKAMGKMADNYLNSECGFPQNLNKAFEFAAKAAREGDSLGQFILARCYHEGHGVDKNYKQAVSYFQKASDLGIIEASFLLGKMICKGECGGGIEGRGAEGMTLIGKAYDQGDKNAIALFDAFLLPGLRILG